MSYEIRPLLQDDALGLVRLHYLAFNDIAGDNFFTAPPTESSYQLMARVRAKVLRRPNVKAYQAVDSSTGKMIGAAIYFIEADGVSQEYLDGDHPMFDEYAPEQNVDLWNTMGRMYRDQYRKYAGTSPAIDVLMYIVDPAWQGKGIGSKLMGLGVEEADRLGLMMYVDATDEGIRAYQKFGFRKVGDIEFDTSIYGAKDPWPVKTAMRRDARPLS